MILRWYWGDIEENHKCEHQTIWRYYLCQIHNFFMCECFTEVMEYKLKNVLFPGGSYVMNYPASHLPTQARWASLLEDMGRGWRADRASTLSSSWCPSSAPSSVTPRPTSFLLTVSSWRRATGRMSPMSRVFTTTTSKNLLQLTGSRASRTIQRVRE